jgi:Ser/Thr protein kinase RdoA (MazF antagonist)
MSRADAEAFLPAAREALAAFPIEAGEPEPIAMAENVTFRVRDRSGAAYTLRLHRPGYNSLEELEAERAWTGALAEAGLSAPRGVRTRDGRWYASVYIPHTDETRHVGLTGWTEGEVLSDVIERQGPASAPGHFARLGAVTAALHNQAAAWTPPAGFVRHALDRDGLMGESPFWGRFWDSRALDAAERGLVLRTRHALARALDRLGTGPDLYGLIHADLHPGNVLVNGEALSVIDFDDAGFGWRPYDIAVALFYQQHTDHFAEVRDAYLAGYRAVRPLPRALADLIPMFLLVRGLALIGWLHQRPELDPKRFMSEMKARILAACEAFEPPC